MRASMKALSPVGFIDAHRVYVRSRIEEVSALMKNPAPVRRSNDNRSAFTRGSTEDAFMLSFEKLRFPPSRPNP